MEVMNTDYVGLARGYGPKYVVVKARLVNKPSFLERYFHSKEETQTDGWCLVERVYSMSYYDSLGGESSYFWVPRKWFATAEEAQEYKTSLETVY